MRCFQYSDFAYDIIIDRCYRNIFKQRLDKIMSVFLKVMLVTLWRMSYKEAMSLVMRLCFLGGDRTSLRPHHPPTILISFVGPRARA